MSKKIMKLAILFIASLSIGLYSCNKDDKEAETVTSTEMKALRKKALDATVQKFSFDANTTLNITSTAGVRLIINGSGLRKNGNPVSGSVDIEYIEIFKKGNMLVTNKPTMGLMHNGNKNLLKSGGEFYIKASQGGVALTSTQLMTLIVPTTSMDANMTLWVGDTTDTDNLVWKEVKNDTTAGANNRGGVQAEGKNSYYVSFGNFGWTNVDRFYSDPRPKTPIKVKVPAGYDNTNSSVYLSYDGEGLNALAKLDTYEGGLFSEHYGQIPIGLNCHIIFATEDNGKWRYAIKGVTIASGQTYTFTKEETTIATEEALIQVVNSLP